MRGRPNNTLMLLAIAVAVLGLGGNGQDALTRITGQMKNAGDRTAADTKSASLLALAA